MSLAFDTPVLPPADVAKLEKVHQLLRASGTAATLRGDAGEDIEIPHELYEILVSATDALRSGKAITVAPVNVTVTTQEAANFLGISRPSVVKLLNESRIPYERPAAGRHRRIRLTDLVDYQHRQRVAQNEALHAIVDIGQRGGLYESELPVDYLGLIESVRKSRET